MDGGLVDDVVVALVRAGEHGGPGGRGVHGGQGRGRGHSDLYICVNDSNHLGFFMIGIGFTPSSL